NPNVWAFNKGPVRTGASTPKLVAGDTKSVRCGLATPRSPVSDSLGNRSAFATPIRAVAATNCCSACTTSGRRWSNSEGRPAGTTGGITCSVSDRPRAIWLGFLPGQQGALRDLQLHVELPQIEIGLRHATHNLQGDGASALLPSQEIRQARLIRPTDSPPN